MISKEEFIKMMTYLAGAKGKTFDANTINVWYALVKTYPLEATRIAFKRLYTNNERFPIAGDLITLIRDFIEERGFKLFREFRDNKIKSPAIEAWLKDNPNYDDGLDRDDPIWGFNQGRGRKFMHFYMKTYAPTTEQIEDKKIKEIG